MPGHSELSFIAENVSECDWGGGGNHRPLLRISSLTLPLSFSVSFTLVALYIAGRRALSLAFPAEYPRYLKTAELRGNHAGANASTKKSREYQYNKTIRVILVRAFKPYKYPAESLAPFPTSV